MKSFKSTAWILPQPVLIIAFATAVHWVAKRLVNS